MPLDTVAILAEAEQQAQASQREAGVRERRHLLIFAWNDEWYAVDLRHVREVAKVGQISSIPGTPPSVLGAMNLRGEILAVADARPELGLPPGKLTEGSRLIVVHDQDLVAGLLVDAVRDTVEVAASSLEKPLSTLDPGLVEFLEGQVTLDNDTLVSVINVPHLLAKMKGE
ncbi:MAG TPA: purine-binding chemotaxis protein CheW [Anaerolineae bacterium]|nr:purine-binding chemotaxis protein CheW [Anaerolineae bacterium]HIQ04303.1 purine-binding chemotaxis protein CheW [Anaerolineae bacterium]